MAPLQRPLIGRVLQLVAGVMLLWLGVFIGLNDQRLGKLVTSIVTNNVKGRFILGYAHYDYWSSLASLILNTAAPVRGGDFQMIDPDGNPVLEVQQVRAEMYIGELVRGLIRTAFSAPVKRGVFIELHFSRGEIRGAAAHIHPTASSLAKTPDRTEINLPATMTGKRPGPPGDQPGRMRVIVDGDGLSFSGVSLDLGMSIWQTHVEGLAGGATLRYSSAASETRPGRPSFVYEVQPLTGSSGNLTIQAGADGPPLVFPLSEIAMRRFGARANSLENLTFRGRTRFAGAAVELDGKLMDTYCDPGVDVQISYQGAGEALAQISGGLLFGSPGGLGRIHGPFSEKLPTTTEGEPAPCLAIRPSPYASSSSSSAGPKGRQLVIEGNIAGTEAELAQIHLTDGQSRFRLVQGVLDLSGAGGTALGGQVRADTMRINLNQPLRLSSLVRVFGADPGELQILPPALRTILRGKLSGTTRLSGVFDTRRDSQRVRFAELDASLERQGGADALPRKLNLAGDVAYTPDVTTVTGLKVNGEGLAVTLPSGTVSQKTGKLNLQHVQVEGSETFSRLLRDAGVPGSVKEVGASLNLIGKLRRPEIEQGELKAHGLEVAGRKVDDVVSGFTLHDGVLALQGVLAKGMNGNASGSATLQLFRGDVGHLTRDLPMTLSAKVADVSTEQLLGYPALAGVLSGQAELGGTLLRPTGNAWVKVPMLGLHGGQMRDVTLDLEANSDQYLLTSLYALFGAGQVAGGRAELSGNAAVGRDGAMPLLVNLRPDHIQLRDIPFLRELPYRLDGVLSGTLQVQGTARPLRPSLSGQLSLDQFVVSGQPILSAGDETAEPEPLFRLLSMVVRTLTLHRADLQFSAEHEGTRITGLLFDAFRVEGLLYLDPADPHGEVRIGFGCPTRQPIGVALPPDCDLKVERLLPELLQLRGMEVQARTSGELQLRFGRRIGPQPLAETPAGEAPLGFHADLRLTRAAVLLKGLGEDDNERRFRLVNRGDVRVSADGESFDVWQADFYNERVARGESDFPSAYSRTGPSKGEAFGEIAASGSIGRQRSDLRLSGQLRLELIEHLLRERFRHVSGAVELGVLLDGPWDRLAVTGTADVRWARLSPVDLDTAIEVASGHLEMKPGQVTVRNLAIGMDGASTRIDGDLTAQSFLPLWLGQMDFKMQGEVSARLLQWGLPRMFSEARGKLRLKDMKITGIPAAPRADGTILVDDVFLSLRRFHELQIQHGSLRLVSESKTAPARILLGCETLQQASRNACQPVSGLVDGDGKASLSGVIEFTGIGDLIRGPWYAPLSNVDVYVRLDNVRHSSSGVYNVEVSAPALHLTGDRTKLLLKGDVDLISGRYIQPFDLKGRFLARRVQEEEEPFWQGDEYLSKLDLDLNVVTRGIFQVSNNIAELRLSATDLTVSGELARLLIGGNIRVEGGTFSVPGLHGDFQVKENSKIEFSNQLVWPDTPYVDVRGTNVQFDPNEQQRNIELTLRGKVSELKFECTSADGLNASDCASTLLLGGTNDQIRRSLASDPNNVSPKAIGYSDNAAKLLSSQLLTQQMEGPVREKLRLDTVRIQFGVSTFDVQLCKRYKLYMRACGLAEWGLLAATSARYRAFGELQFADWASGQVSFDRIERGFEQIEDTITRFKLQVGARLPVPY